MLRTALKPRWLGLFVVLVLVLVSFFWLGLWQLDVARDKGREEVVAAAAEPVVPIAEALGPHAPFPAGAPAAACRPPAGMPRTASSSSLPAAWTAGTAHGW